MTQYDYIVIGAGSSGCVVANRLIQDRETTVLLLEAGNPDTKQEIHIPLSCTKLLGSEVDWGYFSEPEPSPTNSNHRTYERAHHYDRRKSRRFISSRR